ncbi:MAG: ribbon-helix-helix domain-containing protein [Thermoproteota archaeon]
MVRRGRKTVVLGVTVPKELVQEMDRLVEEGLFLNCSHLVTEAIKMLLAQLNKPERPPPEELPPEFEARLIVGRPPGDYVPQRRRKEV